MLYSEASGWIRSKANVRELWEPVQELLAPICGDAGHWGQTAGRVLPAQCSVQPASFNTRLSDEGSSIWPTTQHKLPPWLAGTPLGVALFWDTET